MRRHTLLQSLFRIAKYRLVVPLLRSLESPEHTARGVLVGVAWALTPLIGIQMPLIALTWVLARTLFGWRFHLLVALAWAWVTNALTLAPTYYVFYLTGQIMLGRWGDLSGYGVFMDLISQVLATETDLAGRIVNAMAFAAKEWGLPLSLGCLPWLIGLSWIAYRWTYRLISARQTQSILK